MSESLIVLLCWAGSYYAVLCFMAAWRMVAEVLGDGHNDDIPRLRRAAAAPLLLVAGFLVCLFSLPFVAADEVKDVYLGWHKDFPS